MYVQIKETNGVITECTKIQVAERSRVEEQLSECETKLIEAKREQTKAGKY